MPALPTRYLRTALLASGALAACNGGGSQEFDLADGANYSLTTDITATETVTLSGTDTTIDWSGLTVDLLGQDVAAGEITEVRIINFANLTKEEVITGINEDTLSQQDLDQAFIFEPTGGATSALASEFDVFGTFLAPTTDFTTARGTFIVSAVTTAPNVADRYRTFEFITLADGVAAQTVEIGSDSAALSFTVQIDAGAGLSFDPDATSHTVAWGGLTTNGQGRPIELEDIDTAFLARYDESLDEMEADFLNLQAIAEEAYTIDVAGYGEVELESLEDASGTKFESFDGEGTWIFALLCSTCINPSPPFLAPITLAAAE